MNLHELVSVRTGEKGLQLIAANTLVCDMLLVPFNQLHRVVAGSPAPLRDGHAGTIYPSCTRTPSHGYRDS
jgi:hypothetical protein